MKAADVAIVVALSGAAAVAAAHADEFFVWYEHGREAWPPSCPARLGMVHQ